MAEIRITMNDKLKFRIEEVADELGVSNTDYIKSLLITDLRKKVEKK